MLRSFLLFSASAAFALALACLRCPLSPYQLAFPSLCRRLSSFLPAMSSMRIYEKGIIRPGDIDWYGSLLAAQNVYAEGNMANIAKTMPTNSHLVGPSLVDRRSICLLILDSFCRPSTLVL